MREAERCVHAGEGHLVTLVLCVLIIFTWSYGVFYLAIFKEGCRVLHGLHRYNLYIRL